MNSNILIIFVGGEITNGLVDENDQFANRGSANPSKIANYVKIPEGLNVDELFPFDNLINSDMRSYHWKKIALVIANQYSRYDGFIVLHDTDTMTYTASAISFMLTNLSKPVVFTGSALPVTDNRTDAIINLSNAIKLAGFKTFNLEKIPEVIICFHDKILRGNRTTKTGSYKFDQFFSPNSPPIGSISERITINKDEIVEPINKKNKLIVNSTISNKVVHVHSHPFLETKFLEELLMNEKVEGIVFQPMGPDLPQFNNEVLTIFERAINARKIVLLFGDSPRFRTEQMMINEESLRKLGVVFASGLTLEAAFTKLSVLLGLGLTPDKTKELLNYNLKGEQTGTLGELKGLYFAKDREARNIELFDEINIELVKYLANNPQKIHQLTSRKFEILIAEMFKFHGYQVELTPETRDGGFDFSAFLVDSMGIPMLTLVEVKKYASDRPVGLNYVRSLYGVVSEKNASRGIIVTSSRFSKDALKFQDAVSHRISLKAYDDLTNWLNQYIK